MAKNPPRYPEFAARVRERMTRANQTLADVAKALDIGEEAARLYREGKRMPRDDKIKKLAKLLGVTPGYLQHGDKAGTSPMPGSVVLTDDEEIAHIRAYRQLQDWGKKAVRARAVELLEEFGKPDPSNPFGKRREGTQ